MTEELAASQLESELLRVVEWLVRNSVHELYVIFGVGSVVPLDRLWTPIPVTVQNLTAFVREAIHAGSFAFGRTDLHIYDATTFVKTSDRTFRCDYPALTFIFCHESDMHFRCEDRGLVEDVKRGWIARGYGGYESVTDVQPRNWVRFHSSSG